MGKKQIDPRIPALIRNGVQEKQRSFFIIVGDNAKNQLPNLHYLMSSADIRMNKSVLWAYKHKLLGFTSHRKKRETKIKKEIKQGVREVNQEDPFELFVSLQNIRYCFYKDTEKILGNTYGMCILQDFEALTPNLLARTIETVEGGGIVVMLLKSMASVKQLYTMTMDIHSRYRTEAHNDVVARFNERFLLSLNDCRTCLVVDDELNVLPISGAKTVKALPPLDEDEDVPENVQALRDLKDSLADIKPTGDLVKIAKTVDQGKAILTFIDTIVEKNLKSTVALTAGRGRGKSAALGVAIAAAVGQGYSNIFITSPSPENLKTLFEFIFKGFDALGYEEHVDYDIQQSTNPAFNKAIVRVNIFKSHRQTIQYIVPSDSHVLGQAELVVIDEAAAIPLPVVKKLLGPYLVFMASTINGYEGTGRSLSLKLIQQLRESSGKTQMGRTLHEVVLDEPIRYAPGDPVEKWLNKLLCLDATIAPKAKNAATPHPDKCQLFAVNRDTLFSYHAVSEAFLHRMMALYVASHYKNTPNDLQLLSDAPAHQLYVLLGPQEGNQLPEPLVVVQVALEGEISKDSVRNALSRGQRSSGDLIPWLMSQQYQDDEFASLSGARIVRIATNPEYMGMGYGGRALDLLQDYFEGKFTDISERTALENQSIVRVTDSELAKGKLTDKITVRDAASMPPLLNKLSEIPPHRLNYMGVSYGLTNQLHKFWKRNGYVPVYLRQTANELTGEHTCVMLRGLKGQDDSWLAEFSSDFHKRFLTLLSFEFSSFTASHALSIVESAKSMNKKERVPVTKAELDRLFTPFDLKRLESYANNLLDYHVIVDMLPAIATMYFRDQFPANIKLSIVQSAVLLGIGLQRKDMDKMSAELNLSVSQNMAMFSKIIRKVSNYFREVLSSAIDEQMPKQLHEDVRELDGEEDMFGEVQENVTDELEEAGDEVTAALREKQRELINALDLNEFKINDDDWEGAKKGASKAATGKAGTTLAVRNSSKEKKRKAESVDSIYKEEMNALKSAKKSKKGKK
ncbi:RNA cytidine acetyltransferase [Yarrowia sp. C11]|nr:RNA cytidine acetyltransferase [Yarrowia sp. E02]KAG5372731.1 RNA cytidine acetyltransferase [Yarrowia sp. C11]